MQGEFMGWPAIYPALVHLHTRHLLRKSVRGGSK